MQVHPLRTCGCGQRERLQKHPRVKFRSQVILKSGANLDQPSGAERSSCMNDKSGSIESASRAKSEFQSQASPLSVLRIPRKWLVAGFSIAALAAVFMMARFGPAGWDASVYSQTVQTVHRGADPYAEGLAALDDYHQRVARDPSATHPYAYVYSPLTLPLIRLLGELPWNLLILLYWLAIATGALLQLWAGYQMADEGERRWLPLILPAAIFFPGLITDDVIVSGNVSYILYGAILLAATRGWKRGRWGWYYAAVILASILKTPMLVFLAFPVLLDRRERLPAALSAGAGLLLFGVQIRLWPEMFREYLRSLRLVFEWLHDFGFGPASVVERALAGRGLPIGTSTAIVYLFSACVLGSILLFAASRIRDWNVPRHHWVPVALVGTALLYPRIMKYDMAAITVPMLLIMVRGLSAWGRLRSAKSGLLDHGVWRVSNRPLIIVGLGWFLTSNIITVAGPPWVPVEFCTLAGIFGLGIWFVYQSQFEASAHDLELARLKALPVEELDPQRSALMR